ncbi:tetratricopeptide repeat protein [Luteimonas marina]|uniref:Tetratricopeptide repeat protein n=1 Tax=Luteimonas marina TaxID=488485 RepID=A0A5C5UD95_9GAMM|nr:tetratricopeptide repeat protein [Luteimonas marina]TWT23530.1 tetratricopeptide repeat protein [Luteimonas marina]
MAKTAWSAFPLDAKPYAHAGDALKKAWPRLHAGDAEPFPDANRATALLKAAGKAAPKGVDAEALASQLQDAWRAFHRGDFKAAFDAGEALGPVGASVAVKAIGIHATYLVDGEAEKLKRYEQAAKLAEAAVKALPDEANSHYRLAFALGRYSQGISIAKALKQGIAGKVRDALDAALELAPRHAEAHTALALYHAEIIGKIGAMIGGLTYGAKAADAESHIKTALKLTPDSPIAQIEYGNVLMLLHGDKKEDAAAAAYEKAAKLKPADAMEALDAEYAREQLE